MDNTSKEEIRQSVRENYGRVAREEISLYPSSSSCCCGATDRSPSEKAVPSGCGCGGPALTPEAISGVMGYSEKDMADLPEGANMGLGCGNPVALAGLKPGHVVVDLGSGGGFDCFIAARTVGKTGRVIGVDMTPDMVQKARRNKEKGGFENVEFRLGEIEHLPVGDNTADMILSNCVINLSPEKEKVFADAFRVLKPGGRLAVSDIVATKPLTEKIRKNLELVSACIGGAATVSEVEAALKAAGFDDIRITLKEESRSIISQWVPGEKAGEYVVSANIEAVKPACKKKETPMDSKTKVKIGLGAAIGVNCIPCFDHLYSKAKEVGLDEEEIKEIVGIAYQVKNGAAAFLKQAVDETVGVVDNTKQSCGDQGSSCGCK